MERRKTIHISEIIQEILNKSNLKGRLDETTISQKWEEVVGRSMAQYTKNVYVFLYLQGGDPYILFRSKG